MEFLKGFMKQKGLLNKALSVNVGEYPSTWTLTVDGTCCTDPGTP